MKIMAVIVLYHCSPQLSRSYGSLLSAVHADSTRDQSNTPILLFDNTPGALAYEDLPENVISYPAGGNLGLAGAYQFAIDLAEQTGCDWLLTLDQDTDLPQDFLANARIILEKIQETPEIAAVTPHVYSRDVLLSPYWFQGGIFVQRPPDTFSGVAHRPMYAINSGAILRISALRQAGGYNPGYPVDGSDTKLFHRLAMLGKRVYVASQLRLQHDFSMLDRQRSVSSTRYQGILSAESNFWDEHMGWLAGGERNLRLAARLIKHRLRREPDLFRLAASMLRHRLFTSKTDRVHAMRSHSGLPLQPRFGAIKVSVCMATYNGARYVEEQIRSILPQLRPQDELIVVDDSSKDNTVPLVRGFDDSRIRLIMHTQNQGVVPTFEEAIRNATGDILFLSDMDDIWAPNKVSRMLSIFEAHPEVAIVASSMQVIDENGTPVTNTTSQRSKFSSRLLNNVIRNSFQGSAMAFRSSLVAEILPFPRNKLFLHDVWIGTRNALRGGKAVYLDEPLLLYRRHASNVSGTLSLEKQIHLRLQLLAAHACRLLREAW